MTLSLCGHQAMSSTGPAWPQTSTHSVYTAGLEDTAGPLREVLWPAKPNPTSPHPFREAQRERCGVPGRQREGPGVGGFGALPISELSGQLRRLATGSAGWTCAWSCPLSQTLAKFLPAPSQPGPGTPALTPTPDFHGTTGQGPGVIQAEGVVVSGLGFPREVCE